MKFIVSSRICWMAIAFAFSATASLAQGKTASGGEAGTKLAAINMRMAIANTAEGKQAASHLETEFMTRRKELEDLSKKINDLQQRLTSGASTLNDEEKERLTLEGQRLSRQLERRQNEFQEDLNDAQSEALSRIGRKMIEVLGKYAPKNGYGAVLDNSSQTTPVMYASTDITEDIVRLYDATYPAKGTAGAGNTNPSSKPTSKPVGE